MAGCTWSAPRLKAQGARYKRRVRPISTDFFCFGRDAIPIDQQFSGLLAETQGHRNTTEAETIERFWNWLTKGHAEKRLGSGKLGDLCDFDASGCKIQCDDIEEDFEEERA